MGGGEGRRGIHHSIKALISRACVWKVRFNVCVCYEHIQTLSVYAVLQGSIRHHLYVWEETMLEWERQLSLFFPLE